MISAPPPPLPYTAKSQRPLATPFAAVGDMLAQHLTNYVQNFAEIAEARASFSGMARFVGRDKFGARLREDKYSEILDDLLEKCYASRKHLSHVVGPGVGKSTRARLFCLDRIGRDINTNVVATSADESVSESQVSLCRQIVAGSQYQLAFPHVALDTRVAGEDDPIRGSRLDKWFVKGRGQSADPTMEAVAAIPRSEARRVDILYADDIMTRLVAESSKMRDSLCRAFLETWIEGRLSNHGWAMVFQNCWHSQDLAHKLREDTRFCSAWAGITADHERMFIRLWNPPDTLRLLIAPEAFDAEPVAAQDGATHEFTFPLPNDPTLFSPDILKEKERSVPQLYRRLWRLRALSNKDRMFSSWDNANKPMVTAAQLHKTREVGGKIVFAPEDLHRFVFSAGWDIAGSTRKGDALSFWSKDANGYMSPVENYLGNFTPEEVVQKVDDAWNRGIKFSRFFIENNATQEKIVQAVRSLALHYRRAYEWEPLIQGYTTGANKVDPELGLPGFDIDLSTGIIVWPAGESQRTDVAHADAWLAFEAAFSECPRFLKKNETPDSVMACWFARRALDDYWPRGAHGNSQSIRSIPNKNAGRSGVRGVF